MNKEILEINNLTISSDNKDIVKNINLKIGGGEIVALIGPNGSGKSSLFFGVMDHPKYKIKEGTIKIGKKDITKLKANEKAKEGIFFSLQHLPEFEGITLANFLYGSYKELVDKNIGILDFYKYLESLTTKFNLNNSLLKKGLNSKLSGGEKKISEMIQCVALKPKFAILDEIDSGVDIDSLKTLKQVILSLKNDGVGFLIISHNLEILENIKPEMVYVIKDGSIIESGDNGLIQKIKKTGFLNK